LAFIANRDSNQVSVLDTGTNHLVGGQIELGAGAEPASVAVTPDGRFAYVADAGDEAVSVIDTATRKTVGEPIEVGRLPFGIAITPDGRLAFVTDRAGEEVSVIDTATRKVVAEIPIGSGGSIPVGVAVSPDGKFAYVTDSAADAVEVIDTETLEVVGEPIEVGEGPMGVEFTPDGETAYVVDQRGGEVTAIDTETRKITAIALEGAEEPRGIVVSPDGKQAFVVNLLSDSVSVINTETNRETDAIPVGESPQEVAITANGKTVYVTEAGTPALQRIDAEKDMVVGSPIPIPGEFPAGIAIAPDQSPIAAFAVPDITAGIPAAFSGAASSDADGTIASYSWTFGDGGTASGPSPSHTYSGPGTYNAKLSVVDDQGCGGEEVFTGRTAYCSGGKSSVVHQVTAKVPAPPIARPPSNKFRFGRVLHNRRNGTARLQVKLPSAGYIFLFGKKVHAVTRKPKAGGSLWLTLHARVEVNKRLKKIHRTPVRIRVTFTPNGGAPKTLHRTIALLRAPRKTHSRN
jgi:YVTN family beta-propeller protein